MTTNLAETVAANLRSRRTALGITQAAVAGYAGVTVETIARLERVLRGRASANANPSLETLDRIAAAVGCSVVDLLSAKKPKGRKDELDLVLAGANPRLRKRIAAVARALKQDARAA